jgi:hypothetical protein
MWTLVSVRVLTQTLIMYSIGVLKLPGASNFIAKCGER